MLKRPIRFLQKKYNSIAFRLINIMILLILFPVVISSIVSYMQYTNNLHQKSAESTYQTITQLSYSLNSYLNELFQLSGTIYYNNELMTNINSKKTDTNFSAYQKEWAIEEQLNEMIDSRSDIIGLYIMSDNKIYHAGVYNTSIDTQSKYTEYDWYKKALKDDNAIFIPTHTEQLVLNPQNKVFSVVRRINSITQTGKVLGVFKMDIKYSTIKSICDKIQMGNDSGLLILDENKSVIYSSLNSKNNHQLYNLAKETEDSYSTVTLDSKKYILSSTDIPSSDWTIISLNSVSELNKSAAQTRNITFLIVLACSVVSIFVLLFFVNDFLHPLLEIVRLMKDVQRGNLDVAFPEKRKDEIGYLGSSFNKMILRINDMMKENTDLVKEVYESKLLQNDAQINALYSQIKPHFLFNTLNMISLLIRCNKSDEALDSIDKLSDLLRCMTKFNREITVKEEINLLNAYLSIQSTRYRDRLDYSINIDESLYSYVIPALSFQPIVENTIVHGCEKKEGKTVIEIYSVIDDNSVKFCFKDNANGMDAQTLNEIKTQLESNETPKLSKINSDGSFPKEKSGIGLLNVNRRIKMKFGEEFGLEIKSTPNVGTEIEITIPKIQDKE